MFPTGVSEFLIITSTLVGSLGVMWCFVALMKRLQVTARTRRCVVAICMLWPLAVWLTHPLFRLLRLSWGWAWLATFVIYFVIAVHLRSRFLIPSTLIGVMLGQIMAPGVSGGSIKSQIDDDIQRTVFWLIAGVVVGFTCDFFSINGKHQQADVSRTDNISQKPRENVTVPLP